MKTAVHPVYHLGASVVLGLLALFVAASGPTMSNLTPEDLAAFANGEAVEVRTYKPYRLVALLMGLTSLGFLAWWYKNLQPIAVQVVTKQDDLPPQTIRVPAGIPAPDKYIDVAGVLANRLRPTLITGNPRIGKGIVVAHAGRHLKRSRDCSIWLIQPKYHPKEKSYWDMCDEVFGFMLEDYVGQSDKLETLCEEMLTFITRWRKQQGRPTLLMFDELSMVNRAVPKWYKDNLVPQIAVEMSSGETDDRAFWGITQSPLVEDIGMSGGSRATFDLLAIENQESQEHLNSLCRSYKGIQKPEEDVIYQQSLSPKKAIWYHTAYDDWKPMLGYADFSDSNGVSAVSSVAKQEPTDFTERFSGFQREGLLETSSVSSEPSISQVLAVQRALTEGMKESDIIKIILGYKAEKYQQGRILLNTIKAILEENQS